MNKGFEVEWTTNVPFDEDLDCFEPDLGIDNTKDFHTLEEAKIFAKSRRHEDYWGAPRITQFEEIREFYDGDPMGDSWIERKYIGNVIELDEG